MLNELFFIVFKENVTSQTKELSNLDIRFPQRQMFNLIPCRYHTPWENVSIDHNLGYESGIRKTQVQIPILPLSCCKVLGNLPDPSQSHITIPIS